MNFSHHFALLTFFGYYQFAEMQNIKEIDANCVETSPFCVANSDCCGHLCVPLVSHTIPDTTVYHALVNVGLRGESQFDLSSLNVCSMVSIKDGKVAEPGARGLEESLGRTTPPTTPPTTPTTPPTTPPVPAPQYPWYPPYPGCFPKTLQDEVAIELDKLVEFVPTVCRPFMEESTKILGRYMKQVPVRRGASYGDECSADARVDKKDWRYVY
ncbi:uncharacterized protein LOC110854980 [Folsomia candida]|uniref:Conotoxin-like peptide n=1 Tax=Folsomia candida TaxID=158441 RepID=A0A226DXU0_FOLCA|nr:uncharacterized protein LOC110854980 [Folsomia candida]OXA49036.1 Conotoxin-like peptide [Folsomia candida]